MNGTELFWYLLERQRRMQSFEGLDDEKDGHLFRQYLSFSPARDEIYNIIKSTFYC